MKRREKTAEELIKELEKLRSRSQQLEAELAKTRGKGNRLSGPESSVRLHHNQSGVDSDSFVQTQSIDFSSLFTEDMTATGSFDIWGEIWESTFGKLLRALPIPAFLVDLSFRVLAVNEACGRISPDYLSILNNPVSQLFSDSSDGDRIYALLEATFSTRKPRMAEAMLGISNNSIWGRMTFRSVRIKKHRFILVLVEDLSVERKQIASHKEHMEQLKTEIARRNSAEDSLAESERRYRQLVENASDIIFRTDPNGCFTYANVTAVRLSGYREEELLGKHYLDLIHPEFRESAAAFLKIQYVEKRASTYHEYLALAKDGQTRWLGQHVQLLSEKGKVTGFQAIARDITERKKAENALIENEKRFRELADLLPQWVYEIDAKGSFTFVNKFGLQETGYSEDDLRKGLKISDILVPADEKRVSENFRRILKGGIGPGTEYTVIGKDGKPRHVIAYSNSITKDGITLGIRGVAVDIGEMKRAQGALRQSHDVLEREVKRRTKDLVAANAELAAINRLSGQVTATLSVDVMVRSALAEISSLIVPDVVLLFLQQGDSLILRHVATSANGPTGQRFNTHRVGECLCGLAVANRQSIYSQDIHLDPRCTWEECKQACLNSFAAIPLRAEKETIGVLALGSYKKRDFSRQQNFLEALATQITLGLKNALLYEQVQGQASELGEKLAIIERAEKEKQELHEQLLQTQKMEAIGRLAGGIAHDFNNLLTVMTGYSHMLRGHFPEGSAQEEKLLQIRHAADRAASLTGQLLAFSRRQVLEMRVVDLNHALSEMEEMLKMLLREDIELLVTRHASPARVTADQDQIWQVVMNLAVNARDAMPEGGKLTIETARTFLDGTYAQTHAEVEPGPYIMMAISDTGVGMDLETQARIFEPFFTTKEKGVGTGLGLSTVFGIVKQHRGHVTVYSETGLGSTFRVYFPETEAPAESIPETPPLPMAARGGETILVVEDEEFVRNYASEALESLGYVTVAAKDPAEAIAISESHTGPIHLLLTDVVLPVMDGRSLFNRLHPQRPQMRVLYMSGYTDDAIVHHGVLDSGVHFIQKPFSVNGLAKKVSEIFGISERTPVQDSSFGGVASTDMEEAEIVKRLAGLPQALLGELSRAALEANRSRAAKAVERIRELDEELAVTLKSWLDRFRFDKIVGLTEKEVLSE